ncbi:hypothetical protein DLAC_02476 [Tieghemostelium lacteum]|uniref:Uncharacterized protein n=1 Tax=Tieghemostelium lacteum TaxID=361077 RepID=A0A152A2J4_TIELA|nr:hypothetical protein DLAC_02476 [Tieghemostelium lacteum]|eukprot:KYR00473.1 hypothetical protein DLAC_02476 [Tieghemostelium lacteum]
MKLFVLLVSILFVQLSFGTFVSEVTITPHENGCGNVYGAGYVIPINTCITLETGYYLTLNLNSEQTQMTLSYFKDNCSSDAIAWGGPYNLQQCTNFSFLNEPEYNVTITTGSSVPSGAIEVEYYYYSFYCSGPTYKKFYTNQYKDVQNHLYYMCYNDKPFVYNCPESFSSCEQTDLDGCHDDKSLLMPYRGKCLK